jgi:hypothetical protein
LGTEYHDADSAKKCFVYEIMGPLIRLLVVGCMSQDRGSGETNRKACGERAFKNTDDLDLCSP